YAAISDDHGQTWHNVQRIGTEFGIKNAVFPAVVAGDNNRASFAFLGTPTGGDYQATGVFPGIWHLYIASTFDGGATWTTVDATPNDPVQRGSICTGGTTCGSDRNLLDFMDATVDREGRVLIGYADGCTGPCVAGPPNSFSALGTIARQSGGKRLFAAYDPSEPGLPGAPAITATLSLGAVYLNWQTPDNNGSPITGYNVFRGIAPGAETFLAHVTNTSYVDRTANTPGVTYYYTVKAINGVGEGPSCREVTAVPALDPCIAPGLTVLTDAEGDELDLVTSHDIRAVALAEPYFPDNSNKVQFTLKMTDLNALSPDTFWRIYFTAPMTTTNYFVDMRTDGSGAVSYHYGLGSATLGNADAGSFNIDGTIVITTSNDKIGGPVAGQILSAIYSRVIVGAVVPDNANYPNPSAGISYTLVGSASCRPNTAPIAQLNAQPLSGTHPLNVRFDGSGSTDPDVGDTIALYTFDFGDGTSPVTQASPIITHTYGIEGEYRASLTVTDSRGKISSNSSQAIISVGTACAAGFPDVQSTDPFYANIRCLVCRGIVSGYSDGLFHADRNVTRGQLSKIVSNSVGYNDVLTTQTYEDVPSTGTFYIYIERLTAHGVMSGYPCGGLGEPCVTPGNRPYFRPNSNASRGQIAKIVSNGAGIGGVVTGQTYEDVTPTNPFYLFVERLTTRGVMGGYGCGSAGEPCVPPGNRPYFRPGALATRGQTTKIVSNTFFPGCNPPVR
ncbi:MAG: S-layer homology domain-containing protein, partial [Chloroflexota bacterium]|nr:S-layer homology domain-containing protein [Chloroflexota bacterium]